MPADIKPTPAPWLQQRVNADIIMIRGSVREGGARDTVAAVDGPHAEPNAALICAAPIMANAIRIADWPGATAIVAQLDGGAA